MRELVKRLERLEDKTTANTPEPLITRVRFVRAKDGKPDPDQLAVPAGFDFVCDFARQPTSG